MGCIGSKPLPDNDINDGNFNDAYGVCPFDSPEDEIVTQHQLEQAALTKLGPFFKRSSFMLQAKKERTWQVIE